MDENKSEESKLPNSLFDSLNLYKIDNYITNEFAVIDYELLADSVYRGVSAAIKDTSDSRDPIEINIQVELDGDQIGYAYTNYLEKQIMRQNGNI